MPRHHEVRRLPYTAAQMHALVFDIARYPEFLPWVLAMRVRSRDEGEVRADMIVGFKGLRETVSCKVLAEGCRKIIVDYVDGPLRHLHNQWLFDDVTDIGDGRAGCSIDFTVEFSFRSRMFEMLAGQMFDRALRKMIAAFEDRAAALYGTVLEGSSGSRQVSATNVA